MKRGDRVSWLYQGTRTYGVITGIAGERVTIPTQGGGSVTRVGSQDDPIVRIKSESTGNAVIKRRSELQPAPKR